MKRNICLLLVIMLFIPNLSIAESIDAINILLLGTDNFGYVSVTDTEELSRADAIFLLSIQPTTDQIKLLNIERDYLVSLPDDLGENKLATATYFGGPEMAIQVVNQLFDLNISLYAHIDINNLITAIDLFGGVDVEVFPEELDGINAFIAGILVENVPPLVVGNNHLNGMQAWSFMGERNHELDAISSNAERNKRQMRFFSAALDKIFTMDMSALLKVVSDVLPLIQTNISMNDLLKTIEATMSLSFDQIDFQRSPKGSYSLKRVSMHHVVVPDDMSSEVKFVQHFLKK